jgi:hypothetical protein
MREKKEMVYDKGERNKCACIKTGYRKERHSVNA